MALNIIAEVCYTCINCHVSKQICQMKNKPIMNIYRDKCSEYLQRKMEKCELCGAYIIELAPHVYNHHKKTMSEYRVLTRNLDTSITTVRRKALWE